MKEKFVNLTKEEIGSINGFIESYEMYLERQGYSFTSIKDLSMKKREGIFHQIELEMEKNNSYNLSQILESHAKMRKKGGYKEDGNEVVLKVPIPEIFSLFRPPRIKPVSFKPFTIKIPKRKDKMSDNKVKPELDKSVKKTSEDKSKKIVEEVVSKPEYFVDEFSDLLYLDVNLREMKIFTRIKFSRMNKVNKRFHLFFFILTLLSAIAAVVMAYDANFNNQLDCFYKYEPYYVNNGSILYQPYKVCNYWGVSLNDWYMIGSIIAVSYLSILVLYLLIKVVISIYKGIYENRMGKLILFSQKGMTQRQYGKHNKIINKLVYEGILFSPKFPGEDK